jgi:hypothetical protein
MKKLLSIKTADLNILVQGGQLYWPSFSLYNDSLVHGLNPTRHQKNSEIPIQKDFPAWTQPV